MVEIAISISVWLISGNILQLRERTQDGMKFDANQGINSLVVAWEETMKALL